MRFKIDENLKKIASVKGAAPEVVAEEMAALFIERGILLNDEMCYGGRAIDVMEEAPVIEVARTLTEYLYGKRGSYVPWDIFGAFCDLIVMGDGPCPYCGGEGELIDFESRVIDKGDYYQPPYVEVTSCEYICRYCGKSFATNE